MSMVMNATAPLVHTAGKTAADLYASANVDFTTLNWFEQQWAAWYLMIGDPAIATGLMSFILHEVRIIPDSYTFLGVSS